MKHKNETKIVEIGKLLYEEYANKNIIIKRVVLSITLGLAPVLGLLLLLSYLTKSFEGCILALFTLSLVVGIIIYQMRNLDNLKIMFTEKAFIVAKGSIIYKLMMIGETDKLFVTVKGNKIIFKLPYDKHIFLKAALFPDFILRIQHIRYVEIGN